MKIARDEKEELRADRLWVAAGGGEEENKTQSLFLQFYYSFVGLIKGTRIVQVGPHDWKKPEDPFPFLSISFYWLFF